MRFALLCLVLSVFGPNTLAQNDSRPAKTEKISENAQMGPENEAIFLSGIRQLTFAGIRAGEGYFSVDGNSMIFQSERSEKNPFYQIYRMDLETGDTERISPGFGKTTCSWIHPDGKRVMFASTHEDPDALVKMKAELDFRASGEERRYSWDYDDTYDLFVFDPATDKHVNLTKIKGYDAEGSYSPDGQWIAFASNRAAFTEELSTADQQRFEKDRSLFMDIFIMRADGSEVKRLTTTRGYDGGPFFSPDGQRICWRRFSEDGMRAEIFTMKTDGTDQKQLSHINAMSWAPSYHPSGEYLIFATNKHGFGNFELYLIDKNGEGDPVRVSYTDKFDGLPMFHPNGKSLSWTSQRTPNTKSQIFIGQWDHARALAMIKSGRKVPKPTSMPTSKPAPQAGATSRSTAMTEYKRIAFVMNKLGVPTGASINKDDLKLHLETLASDATRGRFTGTMGEKLASIYAARRFREIGLTALKGANANVELTAQGATMVLALRSDGNIQEFDFSTSPASNPQISGVGHNVIGVLESNSKTKLPAIVLGAHIDHLGTQGGTYSRSEGDNKTRIHHGADDNASGVAVLLEIAEYLADMKSRGKLNCKRDIIFCCWSAEELGLLGSSHFVTKSWNEEGRPESLQAKFAAYVNMDMVGRLDKKLTIQGVGSSSIWRSEIEKRNAPVGLNIALNDDVKLPTDTSSFYARGVPILAVFTGAHMDYHRYTDTIDKINYDGMKKIARFVALTVRGLALSETKPDYIKHETETDAPSRRSQNVSLGTIPDYAEADIPGVPLQGAVPGGPADKAGVKAGDIIVELAGEEVSDIHTFMGAFKKLKVGKSTTMVVVRDGKEVKLTIVPGERK
ncbi:MAG: Tol biopolymer transport system component [Planctomycetota bacterium]|jgi:Tol biopolymer transport system component